MKKIIIIAILLYTNLNAISLDLCRRGQELMCEDIQRNINQINSTNKKTRLKAITQISRLAGSLPSQKDNKKLKSILKTKVKPQYSSIFGGKFFELLAQKNCDGRIYFVEVKFDKYYNVKFEEREPSKIVIDGNRIRLDNEEYQIPQWSKKKYRSSLEGIFIVPRKDNTFNSTVDGNQDEKICLNRRLNLRDINPPYHAIGSVDQNSIIYNLKQNKRIEIWNKQKGKKVKMGVMMVTSENMTGYISYNPIYQIIPCQ